MCGIRLRVHQACIENCPAFVELVQDGKNGLYANKDNMADYNEKDDLIRHEREIKDFFQFLKSINVNIEPNMIVLDVGAGQGMHCCFLEKFFQEVYSSDIIYYTSLYDGEFFKLLKEKLIRNNFDIDLKKNHFIKSDAMDLIYKNNFFDMVVSFNAFEHISDPQTALDEMIRITKNNGHIFIQFDPIWTADTGSHFFHRVPKPWAHLVCSESEYITQMQKNNATDDEVNEYKVAMNRKQLAYFETIFNDVVESGKVEIIKWESWSGVTEEKHLAHPFLKECLDKGYSKTELLLRGMRLMLRKTPI